MFCKKYILNNLTKITRKRTWLHEANVIAPLEGFCATSAT